MTILLSVVIPTYNERDNIALLLPQLMQVLEPFAGHYEIIVVDDQSPDGTAEAVRQFLSNAVFLLQRKSQRDLSAALADGFNVAQGEYVLAMDADLQHDPLVVPVLLREARRSGADVVVATRYAAGGAVRGWNPLRLAVSRLATRLIQRHLVQTISDPLSGFFVLRRAAWLDIRSQLCPAGFKLLLDILLTKPSLRCEECGYCFAARQHGRSKLSIKPAWAFLRTLWRLQRRMV